MTSNVETVESMWNGLLVIAPRDPGETVRRAAARLCILATGKEVGGPAIHVRYQCRERHTYECRERCANAGSLSNHEDRPEIIGEN